MTGHDRAGTTTSDRCDNNGVTHVVIIGGGPGGYEAALVAARQGADVTVIDREGLGGATVLTDCVPSKTLIASADLLTEVSRATELGIQIPAPELTDLTAVNNRVLALAQAQSDDIADRLAVSDVDVVYGHAWFESDQQISVSGTDAATGNEQQRVLDADAVLIATGAHPRVLADAQPDGERILTWKQVYALTESPEHLIVVGSGVTGAEFAGAYNALGCPVTLVSSRDRVLPGEDTDAADLLEDVFRRRGMTVLGNSRMESVTRTDDGVEVQLVDGRVIHGSHCLLAVGSVPNTADMGLSNAGVELDDQGFVIVDKVSRTSTRGIYAAGDCTGILMLASVSAQQGRIAVSHLLGDVVHPLDTSKVSSNIFTAPEIATVGLSERQIEEQGLQADIAVLPLAANPRAKMQGVHDGFIKLFVRRGVGNVIGGVVVAPRASELIHVIALAVSTSLTADQVADAFTVYPSISGSVAESARRMHRVL